MPLLPSVQHLEVSIYPRIKPHSPVQTFSCVACIYLYVPMPCLGEAAQSSVNYLLDAIFIWSEDEGVDPETVNHLEPKYIAP